MARTFQELDVWQYGMDLAVQIGGVVEKLPRDHRWLADQLMRASESAPSNIAEGFERRLTGDFCRFLHIAKASIGETETHLEYARRRHLVGEDECRRFAGECERIKKMLNSLISYLLAHPAVQRRTSKPTTNQEPRTRNHEP